ncbi:hypothetical protein C6H64_13315 [Photorhabdus luminescens]|nr:hypothetical protein C6H64_13315 [Photorhabdus luminescens]
MKKQMMKTSVLAAVLLSMGMAHAVSGELFGHSTVVVNGSVEATTCEVKIDKGNTIDLGKISQKIFTTAGSGKLVGETDFKVSLTGCGDIINKADSKLVPNVDLKIVGPNTKDGAGYFGPTDIEAGNVAVGLMEKGKDVLLKGDEKIELANTGDELSAIQKEFTVGLVAKDPTTVKAGMNISAPLTLQLIQR